MTERSVGKERAEGKRVIRDLHQLEADRTVEELVQADRAPFGFANSYGGDGHRVVCLVPPIGGQKGDLIDGSYMENFTILSPTGEIRGRTEMHSLTPEQANRVQSRIKIAQQVKLKRERKA